MRARTEGAERVTGLTNEPSPMARIRREHQALAILRVLDGDHGPVANDEVMGAYLDAVGLACGRRDLGDLLARLEGGGLLRLSRAEDLTVMALTQDGHEVANGTTTHDGVARVMPDCPYG